jgi:peptide/nickel transport system permease protein
VDTSGGAVLAYVARRVLTTIPLLLLGTFIIYVLVSISGDPLLKFATCVLCDQSAYDRIIELYQLDRPIPVRYLGWITNALQGDFGPAVSYGMQDAGALVMERAANSARLAIPAFLIIATVAVTLGVYSAVNQYSRLDYTVTGLSFLGISLPTFVFALLLQTLAIILLEATGWRPFFVTGMRTVAQDGWLDMLRAHVLPVLTLVLVLTASESRFQRAAMLEVINSDYIRTARAKGLPRRTVVLRHGLRNALIPMVTIWALDFAALLGGSVITETIFAWPGLGPLFISSVTAQDLNLTMAVVMLTSVLVITFNLIADVAYGWLDPRIRYD